MTQERIRELTKTMLRKKLYVVLSKGGAAPEKIAEADPFVAQGLRSFELREWTVMEGSLGIKVHFSDQSLELA